MTSSDSATGMSKGACVSSACVAIMNTAKPTNWVATKGMPAMLRPKISNWRCFSTIVLKLIEPACTITPTTARTIGSS